MKFRAKLQLEGKTATGIHIPEEVVTGAYFDSLSYSHRKAYVLWIEEAKKAETREKRVGGAVETLNAGKTRG